MSKNLEELNLKNLTLVLGYLAIKDIVKMEEKIITLDRLEFNNRDIAKICDRTESFVRKTKTTYKKKNNGKREN